MTSKLFTRLLGLTGVVLMGMMPLGAQTAPDAKGPDAREIVRAAVQTEITSDREDHSRWRYRDDQRDGTHSVSIVVQTQYGSVRRLIWKNGRPLDAAQARAEEQRVQSFIHDSGLLAKQRKDGAQDDKNATELLNMLPRAFRWRIESEDAETITLRFDPDTSFSPPDMQSRVLGEMDGVLVVNKEQHRIVTISGRLTQDVTIGWGLLGRLHGGGTFRVERREVAPRLWQITETHVHIQGRALFFKNIGQEQDEVQTEFSEVPAGTTLEQAAEMSKVPEKK